MVAISPGTAIGPDGSGVAPPDDPGISAPPFRPLGSEILSNTIPAFYVGRNNAGFWVVREASGRSGGLFLFRRSALWFVKRKSFRTGCATIFLTEPFELDLNNRGNPFVEYLVPLMKRVTRLKHRFRNFAASF